MCCCFSLAAGPATCVSQGSIAVVVPECRGPLGSIVVTAVFDTRHGATSPAILLSVLHEPVQPIYCRDISSARSFTKLKEDKTAWLHSVLSENILIQQQLRTGISVRS